MISIDEIDKTILELEAHDTTYATCEKLAWLYICRDHLVSMEGPATAKTSGSAFLDAVDGCPINKALKIIDEHMECIKNLYPREYEVIVGKIKDLK